MPAHRAAHKRARVAYCLLMIEEWLNNQLAGYVWIDQKKMWVHPGAGGVFCWSLKGQTSTEQPRVIETLLMSKEYKGCCNYSYQAANAILGPFFIAFTTGTHGHYLKSNTPNKMHYWGLGYKTMAGEQAKTPPSSEIRDLIKRIWLRIKSEMEPEDPAEREAQIRAGKKGWRWPKGLEPVYSLDNAAVHVAAVQGWDDPDGWRIKAGIKGRLHMVPDYSPDLHQVIEHAIGNMSKSFHDAVAYGLLGRLCGESGRRENLANMLDFMWLQKWCYQYANGGAAIAENCYRLLDTYLEVVKHGGDWPRHGLR
uniref:Uncharacterized protein n=1 Tax=Chlamydomonas leiostraca TaxID=1034604 RepID=A0A7S0RG60_9CHLO|mmetsp:Transcript_21220/g.53953  ORF Transcript_21220/g.53953 Transcript_21220/m.53953 type:complete len:309 (+) Transcript_21220:123-1049(+)